VAATTPVTLPWELSSAPPPDVITGYKWELYNVKEDPTQYNDLAAKMPEKVTELQALFDSEAKKYNVMPLDNSTLPRWNAPRPSLTAGRTVFTYSGELRGVPASAAPSIRRGRPVFLYNLLNLKRTIWSGQELDVGKHTIVFDFKLDGPGLGKGGTGVLSVDGKEVDRKSIEHGTPVTFPEDETFDVGQDSRTGVAMIEYRYDPPFKFTGKINKLTFKLEPELKDPAQAKAELGPTPAPEPDPIEAPKR
jgi:arylsulfatase